VEDLLPIRTVVVVVGRYPQFTETWSKNEIETLSRTYDVHVVGTEPADMSYKNHRDFKTLGDAASIAGFVKDVKADVIHGHVLTYAPLLHEVAQIVNVPFTIRSHSFDVLEHLPSKDGLNTSAKKPVNEVRLRKMNRAVADDLCLGVLAFPFARPAFKAAGMPDEKVIDCFPVVAYEAFLDRSPNGSGVINSGAYLPKKKMEDFVRVAGTVPERTFNLYAVSTKRSELDDVNSALGSPVVMHDPVEPEDMPREYKKNEWLLYTADWENRTVGWPVAVAEAQAAGVGVCMAALRPDLQEFVGEAGYLFDNLEEARQIIAEPFPAEKRELGFELAKRSDVNDHIKTLTDLWA
jgi:hypothetical protein